MNKKIIIGLSGRKQSGKDTVYKLMEAQFANDFSRMAKRFAFADPLYYEAADVLDIDVQIIRDNKSEFRTFLQWYGTDYIRNFLDQPDYWINLLRNNVTNDLFSDTAIVTDVRFINEANAIESMGGFIIHIDRPLERNSHEDQHSSEVETDEIGSQKARYRITNDGSERELSVKIYDLLNWMKAKELATS